MRIFIVGPGGVGKTTVGKILSEKLDYEFVDIDQEFNKRIENIGKYIDTNGYESYCYKNSSLFKELLNEFPDKVVMPLSSGFLVHENLENLTILHKRLIKENGYSLLLLPHLDPKVSAEIVVDRQIARGFGDVTPEKRAKGLIKYIDRHNRYLETADQTLFSFEIPDEISDRMLNILTSNRII